MSGYGTPPPTDAGERWNVNLPAVIGVVFVFLVAVIVWVIVRAGGTDETADSPGATTVPTTTVTTTDPEATTVTTTPAPMPDLSQVTTTTVPGESAVTTAPGAQDGAVPGDLAIPGRPMQRPPCNDSYITIVASAVGDQASAAGIAQVLDTYPGSEYLRTDQTCSSLRADVDGEPIYVVYLGPFAVASDACAARAEGPEGAYPRRLSNDIGPDEGVSCS